ncbi:MAG: hypothetical protein WCY97_02525 [Methanothrix sp.]|jgi:hypothetical protein|uniref:Uncharacterized protein n=1 Tax=Methanothrix harundinacea TaxID=301375 RepID=A0A101IL65_9EURY|nr:MAG: hypothetical protein XD72_0718 [Methanothrix harundinacea]KUK97250.1 MAG: hypothetical protein XE07_0405 [Methanothrix harundinacea]MDD2637866.1 hypothetical protein [Methanothrix sp.]MDD5768806.1 hypothetical protein [Methanothrix sp.]HRW83625.1 hypothetical protein [Methanothrix sp.]
MVFFGELPFQEESWDVILTNVHYGYDGLILSGNKRCESLSGIDDGISEP